jgi:hypothetical protein
VSGAGFTDSLPSAAVETDPVPHRGDAADDPAVWVHPSDPARSTIIGTDKKGGIAVYDLEGKELQYRPEAKINNVDGAAIRRPTVGEGGGEDGDAELAERAVRSRGDAELRRGS